MELGGKGHQNPSWQKAYGEIFDNHSDFKYIL